MTTIKVVLKILLLLLVVEVLILVTEHFIFINSKRQKNILLKKQNESISGHELINKKNLEIPADIQYEATAALQHYPELYEENIQFIIKPASFPLASRPQIWPLLFPWMERRYQIIISNQPPKALSSIMYQNLPVDARIGVLGHELAHTFYYYKRSNLQIIYTGILYLNEDFRNEFERATDIDTIKRGLGQELYQWSLYLQEAKSKHPEIEKVEFIFEDRYLSPEEIKRLISKSEK